MISKFRDFLNLTEPPDINACCGNGCEPCIFDLHDIAMDEYRRALRAWQARQDGTPPSAAS